MKTILAATDYSTTSLNALRYAAELALQTKSNLLLYHAFQVPVISSEAVVVAIPFGEIEKQNNSKLKIIVTSFRKKYGNKIEINYLAQMGFTVDVLEEVVKTHKIDLMVMGIKGAGKISEIVIGSRASDVTGRVNCPVLIIPEKASFKKLKKIVFASDNEKISDTANFKVLKELTYIFKSKLILLNVRDPSKLISSEKRKISQIEKCFKGIKHSVNFITNKYDDVVAGINDFVKDKDADMVAMISRKHSLLCRIFNERKTKKMAFHTHVPLLSLND